MFETMSIIKLFIADRRAVTALEYGLIAGLIGVVIIGGVSLLGTDLNSKFSAIATSF
jgi:pilus assembly protein Flp/PilA